MKYIESEKVELKEIVTKDIKKEIVAFANTDGGELYIGVRDDGTIVGVENPEENILSLISMLRDSIKPDIMSCISTKTITEEDKKIILISVARGTSSPYYIEEKGLKPSGVYVRQGTASAPASEAAIRKMIKITDGDSYEKERAIETELTFYSVGKEFESRGLKFNLAQMKTLGILKEEGIYTNLGLILSDQCKHTIKIAIFYDNNKMKFKDRKEFSGSILKQLNETYTYIDLANKTGAEIKGLMRIDKRDYPEEAIREALINTIVHREYSFSGSILISIFDDRIEFVSMGGLFGGITMKDISLGISQTRNEKLAAIFYRMQLIEAYGTGIAKIMNCYSDSILKPEFRVTDNAFMVILPKKKELELNEPETDKKKIILNYIEKNKRITRKDAENILGIGQTMAGRVLKELIDDKVIRKVGKGANTVYVKVE